MESLIKLFFFIFNQKISQYQKMNSLRMLQMELEVDPNFFQKPNILDFLILKIFKTYIQRFFDFENSSKTRNTC
jgi:hypothetical protein